MQPYCYCIKIATPHTLVHDCRSLSLFLSLSDGVLLTLLHATVANGAQLGAAINVAQCLTCYTVAVAGFLLHYVPSIYMRIF